MQTLLLIMNPRQIPACTTSLEALHVDQAWMTGYMERDLPINKIVEMTNYDRYSLISDDAIVTADAFGKVLAGHDDHPECVVTGWSQLARDDDRANLVDQPLGRDLAVEAYSLLGRRSVDEKPPLFETWFSGYAFTTASRDVWLRCPFQAMGNANDFYQSHSFTDAGVRILAARDGEVEHDKEEWNKPDLDDAKRSYVGTVPAEVRWRFR